MMKMNEITACVVDHGLFLPVAVKLAEQYKHVYYWSPWERDFPTVKEGMIGTGFDNMTRVGCIWDVKEKCDLFVFPDIGFAGMQSELRRQGYAVWGSGAADSLEINRGLFLKKIGELGLKVASHEVVLGWSALRDHLQGVEDRWIKISKWRGDAETFHWQDWDTSEPILDLLAMKFGPAKELVRFYVFDPIDTDIEDGLDTYCIDGKLPRQCLHGMEAKDKAYLGAFVPYESIPEQLTSVTSKFADLLRSYGSRGSLSVEIRIKDNESYFIDPTLRFGSPPSQSMTELFSNLGEIIWAGAMGECVEPEPSAKFCAQLAVNGKGDKAAWFAVELPESIRQWLKCGSCFQLGNRLVFPPDGEPLVGWLVAAGDTLEATIETMQERIADLPESLCCEIAPLAELLVEAKAAEAAGMEFSDQPIPEPEKVLQESH